MALTLIITDPGHSRVRGARAAILALVLLSASTAGAHGTDAKGARSLLRLQGNRVAAPSETPGADEMVLTARGVDHRFRLSDRRRFELVQSDVAPPRERDRLTLQGDFDVLARFAKARADQQVTILGELRAGSADLFILTLDLCPP